MPGRAQPEPFPKEAAVAENEITKEKEVPKIHLRTALLYSVRFGLFVDSISVVRYKTLKPVAWYWLKVLV